MSIRFPHHTTGSVHHCPQYADVIRLCTRVPHDVLGGGRKKTRDDETTIATMIAQALVYVVAAGPMAWHI